MKVEQIIEMLTGYIFTYGVKLILAVVIFIIGKWLAQKVSMLLAKGLAAKGVDVTLVTFVKNLLYYVLLVMVVVAALGQLGIQTASFVAIIGAAGLAIGLALQGSLANFAAGVLMILFRPIKLGDFVEVAGVAGKVSEISIFSTTLLTGDNKTVIISNADVTGGTITNYSTQSIRRIDLVVGVSYAADIKQVKEVLAQLANDDERILTNKEVTIGVLELADSSINFVFRPWVNSADYWAVHFDLHERIKYRFDELGIGIPYPTMDMNINKASLSDVNS